MSDKFLQYIEKKVLNRAYVDFPDAVKLSAIASHDLSAVMDLAERIRRQYFGVSVELCSIYPIKIGMCPEDCKFCSQSIYHSCEIQSKDMACLEEILDYLLKIIPYPVSRFSLVSSGPALTDHEFELVVDFFAYISRNFSIELCASLGFLTIQRAKKLIDSGVSKYHNNLETSKDFFPNICTTHAQKEKIETIRLAKSLSMQVCSGGIIGMGESMLERIKLAFQLRELGVDSVPINILNPIKGTALESRPLLPIEEILATLSLFRIILPDKVIVLAGGKENALKQYEWLAYKCGVNACMVGNYLTTPGQAVDEKVLMLKNLGLEPSIRPKLLA